MITKEMIREKKRQIVKAEKNALQVELSSAKEEAVPSPDKKLESPFKKTNKAPTAEELALEQKRKMAEAIKAVIKTNKEDKEKIDEKKVNILIKINRDSRKKRNRRKKSWENRHHELNKKRRKKCRKKK